MRAYEDVGMVGRRWGRAGSGLLYFQGTGSTRRMLILRRSAHVLEPNTWGAPGGAIPEKRGRRMDAFESARKETVEEVGRDAPDAPLIGRCVFQEGAFRYTTFMARAPRQFTPRLNWENTEARWGTLAQARKLNLHPGMRWLLDQPCFRDAWQEE